MGEGASILLKTAHAGPKSAKQAEIRLASFPKILHKPRLEPKKDAAFSGEYG
jgi:hypothetical protein